MDEANSARSLLPGATSAGSVCTACALCCDGTLFATAPVTSAEQSLARRLRLVATPAGHALEQPCLALDERRCGIYEERPSSCRAFHCLLLEALRAGEVNEPEALAVVGDARARAAGFPSLREARREVATLPGEERERLLAFEAFLDLRFRGRSRR